MQKYVYAISVLPLSRALGRGFVEEAFRGCMWALPSSSHRKVGRGDRCNSGCAKPWGSAGRALTLLGEDREGCRDKALQRAGWGQSRVSAGKKGGKCPSQEEGLDGMWSRRKGTGNSFCEELRVKFEFVILNTVLRLICN